MKRYCGLLLCMLLALDAAADGGGRHILDCARQNLPPSVAMQDVEMVATDRSGAARTLVGKLYSHSEAPAGRPALLSVLLRVEMPRDLSGASYLVRHRTEGEETYMFLPSLQRVRRINGNTAGGPLFGTSFSYSDFRQIASGFDASAGTLDGSAELEGRATTVVSMQPSGAEPAPYSLIRSWVDRQTCVPLKVEFYQGAAVRKRFQASASALRQAGRYWYLGESVMRDLVEGSSTTLRIGKLSGEGGIPGGYFQPDMFFLGN
jgi:hypothetical protein